MACRLSTINRYRSERRQRVETEGAALKQFGSDLRRDVRTLRDENLEELCGIAAFVNDQADATLGFLKDRRTGRREDGAAMRADMAAERARIRADMIDIVSSDFH